MQRKLDKKSTFWITLLFYSYFFLLILNPLIFKENGRGEERGTGKEGWGEKVTERIIDVGDTHQLVAFPIGLNRG